MHKDAKEMLFNVTELFPDESESKVVREFSISEKETQELYHCGIDSNTIVLLFFNKIYQFSIGRNGFSIRWDENEDGTLKEFESGFISWPGPRAPAVAIGGKWWKIKRVS